MFHSFWLENKIINFYKIDNTIPWIVSVSYSFKQVQDDLCIFKNHPRKKLNPNGRKPLRVDKLASWIYGGKVYLFGGFGPPPDPNKDDISCSATHAVDPSTVHWGWRNTRGWTNQLVIYDIATNAWEWPTISGNYSTSTRLWTLETEFLFESILKWEPFSGH